MVAAIQMNLSLKKLLNSIVKFQWSNASAKLCARCVSIVHGLLRLAARIVTARCGIAFKRRRGLSRRMGQL